MRWMGLKSSNRNKPVGPTKPTFNVVSTYKLKKEM
uniref:Uncharacterized protein n=1 Tax=Nelumbo nucifera TaxID=4432 RepID=A0A822XJ77_NELNU|nr:TPA_asm: hypothetical protein HUJ06_021781 [Nelumbo nucifera]